MHGDSLCTDDIGYQQFRTLVRDPRWQEDFLSKSPHDRLQAALEARDASTEHKGDVDMYIMDVNAAEVVAVFERHGVSRMIHGHTHRPAAHKLDIKGQPAQRIVLGDWYTQGSVLRVQAGGRYDLARLQGSESVDF
jgi:UDP-2,3-diacylglucosamine hydrolase